MRIFKTIGYILVYFVLITITGCSKGTDQVILLENQSEEVMSENTTYTETLQGEESKTEADNRNDSIFVYICGAVNQPGVYELPANARVFEAIDAAFGYLEGAAEEYMNQAALLTDGQQIRIPTVEEAEEMRDQIESAEIVTAEQGQLTDSDLININSASASQLMTLSGIGEAKANAIIAYRETNGSFNTIEELMNIAGIKDGVFQKLKDQITVQ